MPPLPAWLAAGLADRPDLLITARQTYSLRAVDFDQPALIVPLQGEKVFTAEQVTTHVGPGSYLMVHRACRGTVENIAGPDCYRAWCIVFPWRVVELARRLLETHALPPAPAASHSGAALAPLHEALRYFLDVLNGPGADAALVDHALVGVLLALHRSGDSQFRLAQDLSVAARIRLQVGAQPGRDWCSADFEASLHISGATLRRRLAEEHTSLREVLRDARLYHAMALLQTTRRPVKAIALACGYRSVPSFTRQFALRFGALPGAVGNAEA